MLKPVNKHLLIEPIKHEAFIASQHETFQEIGKVLDIAADIYPDTPIEVGDHVYFDSWLAARFPGPTDDSFYWLVKYEDVRGYDKQRKRL